MVDPLTITAVLGVAKGVAALGGAVHAGFQVWKANKEAKRRSKKHLETNYNVTQVYFQVPYDI
jgi:hypothetical protein